VYNLLSIAQELLRTTPRLHGQCKHQPPCLLSTAGYTGHQPHSDTATAAAHPAAAAPAKPQALASKHAAPSAANNAPQHSRTAPQAPLQAPQPQLAHTTTAANTFGRLGNSTGSSSSSSSSSGYPSQQHQYSSYTAGSASIAGYPAAATAAEFGASAGSRISSPPRYFCDGVEVPSGQVPQAPPGSAAPTDTVVKCGSYSSMGVPQPNSSSSSGCMPHASHGVTRSGHQAAEVLLLNQSMRQSGGSGPAVGLLGEHGNAAMLPSNRSGQGAGGSDGATFGVGGVGGVRVGRPAIGPWSSTYASTFVQQEAYHSLMQQFKEAALQRQQQQHRQ